MMIRPTRNQWVFITLFVVYTLTFQTMLGRFVEAQRFALIVFAATGYGLLTFVTGLLLGRFDSVRKFRGDLGFYYHFYTFIIAISISFAWWIMDLSPSGAMGPGYWLGAGGWLLGLAVHFAASRKSVKGISKGQVFD